MTGAQYFYDIVRVDANGEAGLASVTRDARTDMNIPLNREDVPNHLAFRDVRPPAKPPKGMETLTGASPTWVLCSKRFISLAFDFRAIW